MKKQTLFALALGTLLAVAVTGCKNTSPRLTKLPDPTMTGGGGITSVPTPDGGGTLAGGDKAGVNGVSGTDLGNGNLPNDDKLLGRDQDRSTFAAQTVYFEYDHSNVRADEASKIDQVAATFRTKGADFDLLIEGHCDERGTEEYNRSLGERRALAIRELLIRSGVDAGHVFTRSFGKDKPAMTGHDETTWSKNRRGEFVLVLPKKMITTQNQQ
jgi:outer membrane protein OmpA-like peptidoglycan-associated protein